MIESNRGASDLNRLKLLMDTWLLEECSLCKLLHTRAALDPLYIKGHVNVRVGNNRLRVIADCIGLAVFLFLVLSLATVVWI